MLFIRDDYDSEPNDNMLANPTTYIAILFGAGFWIGVLWIIKRLHS